MRGWIWFWYWYCYKARWLSILSGADHVFNISRITSRRTNYRYTFARLDSTIIIFARQPGINGVRRLLRSSGRAKIFAQLLEKIIIEDHSDQDNLITFKHFLPQFFTHADVPSEHFDFWLPRNPSQRAPPWFYFPPVFYKPFNSSNFPRNKSPTWLSNCTTTFQQDRLSSA